MPLRTAFVGLDYIVDIVHPSGKLVQKGGHPLDGGTIDRVNGIISLSGEKNWLRILVKVGFMPGYVNLPKQSPFFGAAQALGALELGSSGTEFHPDLRADLVDMIVQKPRVSAFYCTSLESALRANKIERLVLAGVSTPWAVQATARDAHDRDYSVVIVEDACAAASQDAHRESIELLSRIAQIMKTEELTRL
jgi:biuret amidohydrolase